MKPILVLGSVYTKKNLTCYIVTRRDTGNDDEGWTTVQSPANFFADNSSALDAIDLIIKVHGVDKTLRYGVRSHNGETTIEYEA